MKEDMVLRNARSSVRKILLSCHSRHFLDTGLNTKFGDYLASELKVTADAEQLSGKSHWWTPSSLSREQSSTLAVPAVPQTVDVVPGPAAPSARATWAFNRHRGGPHTCADGCRHPVASSSGASPDHTGPPSFSPGVESLPYCLLGSGIRDSNWAAAVAAATVPNPAVNVAGPPAAAPRQAADLLRRTGGGGSGLRHLAPAIIGCPPSRPRCPPSRSPPRQSQIPPSTPPDLLRRPGRRWTSCGAPAAAAASMRRRCPP
jgi:hypothetical protein